MTNPLLFPDESTKSFSASNFPLLTRVMVWILLPILLLLSYVFLIIQQGAPSYEGEVKLNGLTSKVNVTFDTNGVPAIFAKFDHDAFFAQGYLHANDRLWQMDMKRRRAKGTLSELYGEQQLNGDVWFRTLNLQLAAEKAYLSLNKAAQKALQAYSDGVNAYIDTIETLPTEYIVLQNENVAKWSPVDSLIIHKLMAFSLSGNMFDELRRKQAVGVISTELMQHFYSFDKKSEVEKGNDWALPPLSEGVIQQSQVQESMRFVGSNAWVVAGDNTNISSSLLANDPHLALELPSPWYQIQMTGDKIKVKGVSLVGLPGIMVGANEDIGWGMASLIADQQDLYIYDPSYTFEERRETAKVRLPTFESMGEGLKEVDFLIREAPFGPVISDSLSKSGRPLALRWVGLQDKDKSFEALYKLQYATNWEQFRSALSQFKSPGLHFLYADRLGNIGSQVVGHFPKRIGSDGRVPQPSLDEVDNWSEIHRFETLPSQYNPEKGIIVAANEVTKLEDGSLVSYEAAPGYRKKRIEYLLNKKLENKGYISSDDMRTIQLDTIDLSAKALHKVMTKEEVLRAIRKQNSLLGPQELETLLDLFQDWDFSYSKENVLATVYHYWFEAIKAAVVSLKVSPNDIDPTKVRLMKSLIQRLSGEQLLKFLKFEVVSCSTLDELDGKCTQLISKAFNQAIVKIIKETKSTDLNDWQWQNVHLVKYENIAYKDNPLTNAMWSDVRGSEGSEFTVNVGNAIESQEGGFIQTLGATFRLVQYFSEDVSQDVMLPLGQSGHVMSSFYYSNQQYSDKNREYANLVLLPMGAN